MKLLRDQWEINEFEEGRLWVWVYRDGLMGGVLEDLKNEWLLNGARK